MNFNLPWSIGLAGLLVLVCTVASAEDAKPKQPKPTGTAQNQTPSSTDLFTLPKDPNPRKLLRYIDDLMFAKQPQLDSPEATAAHYDKVVAAVMSASQKILDTKDVEEYLAIKALEAQFMSLSLKTRMGDKNALKQRLDLAQKYSKDPRAELVKIALEQRVYANLQQFDKLQPKEQEKLWDEAVAYLESTQKLDEPLLRRISTIGKVFEGAKTEGLSARVYGQLSEMISHSKLPEMEKVSKQLARMCDRMQLVGKPFELTGQLATGQPFDWAKYRGKVVLVDFWGSWSSSAVTDLPNLKSLYQGYASKGFDIVGVSKDTNKIALDRFLSKNQIAWSNLYNIDEDAEDHPVAEKYGIVTIPYRVLVGKDGKVIKLNPTLAEVRETLKDQLGPSIEPGKKADAKSEGQ